MPQCKYGNEATRATAKDRTIRRHNAKQCTCYGIKQPSSRNTGNTKNTTTTPGDSKPANERNGNETTSHRSCH